MFRLEPYATARYRDLVRVDNRCQVVLSRVVSWLNGHAVDVFQIHYRERSRSPDIER